MILKHVKISKSNKLKLINFFVCLFIKIENDIKIEKKFCLMVSFVCVLKTDLNVIGNFDFVEENVGRERSQRVLENTGRRQDDVLNVLDLVGLMYLVD